MSASQLASTIRTIIRPILSDAEVAILAENGYGSKVLALERQWAQELARASTEGALEAFEEGRRVWELRNAAAELVLRPNSFNSTEI